MTTGVLYHKAMAGCVFFPEHCIHGAGRSHCDRFGVPSSPKNCRNKPRFDIVRWFQTVFSQFSPPHLLGRWVTTLMCLPSFFRFIRWNTILVEISWVDFRAPGRLAGTVDSGAREKTSAIDDDTTIGPGMFWWPNRLIWKMWLQRIFVLDMSWLVT